MTSDRYREAGVDLTAAETTVERIGKAVRSTHDERVISEHGSFGGLFRLDTPEATETLVASSDGVGTKTKVATALGRYRGLGEDLVNHCLNDILTQGAEPLFFLDYLASSRLDPQVVEEVVAGIAAACRASGMPLLGGETAELPGVYRAGELDIVGTVVGRRAYPYLSQVRPARPGDRLLALASGGLQTNGFSLARTVLEGRYQQPFSGTTVGAALLAPHRSFLTAVRPLLTAGIPVGLAHVTGGGIPGNLPRALPPTVGARVHLGSWEVPEIFAEIERQGAVPPADMRAVFNLGVGFIVVCPAERIGEARKRCPEPLSEIGEVVAAPGVRFV